jgi:hypothetical protein
MLESKMFSEFFFGVSVIDVFVAFPAIGAFGPADRVAGP